MESGRRAMDMETLYREYAAKVGAYMRSRVHNAQDAEDLASAVFVKAAEHLAGYDPAKASYSTWIYTIAQNTVRDYFRTAMRHPAAACIDDMDLPDEGDIESGLLREETLEYLAAALEKLPERERDVIVLRFYRGKTPREVALLLDISYANARYLQSVALKKLRALLPEL